jgi:hypothetical protein
MPILCPICEKDDRIQKVSSVYDSGRSFGNYRGPATTVVYSQGKTGLGGTYVSGTTVSETPLANKLSPPIAPKKPSFPFYFYFGLINFVVGICFCLWTVIYEVISGEITIYNISKINGLESFILFVLCCMVIPAVVGIVTIVLGIITKQQQVESYPGRLATFNKDLEVWNRLYYCHRDDAVFDPSTGEVWQFTRAN